MDGMDEMRARRAQEIENWKTTYGEISEANAVVMINNRMRNGVIFGDQYFIEGSVDYRGRFSPAMMERLEGKVTSKNVIEKAGMRVCQVSLEG